MNTDNEYRLFRFIEIHSKTRKEWLFLGGILKEAEAIEPKTPKAILEEGYIATLPCGTMFKEISFKREHKSIEQALEKWCLERNRSWAKVVDNQFVLSNSESILLDKIMFKKID